jgi:uncharacterized protein YbjT (DUF2867 family)
LGKNPLAEQYMFELNVVIVPRATGFIGLPVAQALVRAGHDVIGQTRSADKARQLTIEESKPNK